MTDSSPQVAELASRLVAAESGVQATERTVKHAVRIAMAIVAEVKAQTAPEPKIHHRDHERGRD